MNPKSLTTLLLGIVASLCLATQCPKEESPNELPPETQTGANTFGCYVNGELFVKANGTFTTQKMLSAIYEHSEEFPRLQVSCVAMNGIMMLFVDNPQKGDNMLTLSHVLFNNYTFASKDSAHVFLTRFDTINGVVSGTFEFSARDACTPFGSENLFCGDSTVLVTDGRFDVKF